MLRVNCFLCALMLALMISASAFAAPGVDDAALDRALADAAKYKMGDSRAALNAVSDVVVAASADPANRQHVANRMVDLLQNPAATHEARDFACRQLWIIGTKEQVPALAKLLTDEAMSHLARFALERIDDPSVDAALREALIRTEGLVQVGIINSIGARRDAEAVDALAALLKHDDAGIASAAAASLGKIGTEEAVRHLNTLRIASSTSPDFRVELAMAQLAAAEQLWRTGEPNAIQNVYRALSGEEQPTHIRMAAIRGAAHSNPPQVGVNSLVNLLDGPDPQMQAFALRELERLHGGEATAQIAAALDQAAPATQAMLLEALANRRDKSAMPAVVKLARHADPGVSSAAVTAIASLGNEGSVALLVPIVAASPEPVRSAAVEALGRLRGEGADAAILAALPTAADDVKVVLVKVLGKRQAAAAADDVVKLAGASSSPTLRREAYAALTALGSGKHIAPLVQLMLKETDDGAREAAEQAIIAAGLRGEGDRAKPVVEAMRTAEGATKLGLIRVAGKLGGASALSVLRQEIIRGDQEARDAAVRALADFPDAAAADDLWQLAKTSESNTHRILALRGYIRLVRESDAAGEQKVKQLSEAMNLAARPDEKRLAIAALADIPHPAALAAVRTVVNQEGLKAEAQQAIRKIERSLSK